MQIITDVYETSNFDNCANNCCGSSTIYGILEISSVKIPLCRDCLKELSDEITEFNNKKFCIDCEYFDRNEYGNKYPGKCKKTNKDAYANETCFAK